MTAAKQKQDNKPLPVSKARIAAARVLTEFCKSQKPANLLVHDAMARLSPKDQPLMAELVYGTIRWQIQADWLLAQFVHGSLHDYPFTVQSILRTAIYQLHHLSHIPAYAVIHQAVAVCRHFRQDKFARLVNAVLRNYQRGQDDIKWPEHEKDLVLGLSIEFAFSKWLVTLVVDQYGAKRAPEILGHLNQRPWLTLRVNTLKTTVASYQDKLRQAEIAFSPGKYLPEFLHLRPYRGKIQDLPGYATGLFSIQDESAGLVASVTRDSGAKNVTDICAAPGGKASFLAELSGDKMAVLALDLSQSRLRLVSQNLNRLGITGVKPVRGDGTRLPIRNAETILLDAPCSGLGVIRKNPDIKIRRTEEDLAAVCRLQEQLLEEAAKALRPEGTLIYGTCTINRQENEEMIKKFLGNHPEFSIVPISKRFAGPSLHVQGWLNTAGELSQLDGGFCVGLQKGKTNGS